MTPSPAPARRTGRPRLYREPLTLRLTVKLNDQQRRELASQAAAAGYRSVSGYARQLLLAAPSGTVHA